jgi:hypothetical protein
MDKTQAIRIGIFAVIIAAIVIIMSLVVGATNTSTKYDTFAQCIKEKGATFYGAFWCPHCQAQKKAFGGSSKYLPYVECSNPDQTQNALCTAAKIESYPTWQFADGTRATGEQSMEVLAAKTGCALPQ